MQSRKIRMRACQAVLGLSALTSGLMMSTTALAQDGDLVAQYEATLEQIKNTQVNLTRQEFYLEQQSEQIESLEAAVADAEAADPRAQLMPIVQEMVAELERFMVADLPFNVQRRFALLDDLRADLQQDDVLLSDAYRRAMEIYGLEVEAGLQVGTYTGQHPVNAGVRYQACVEDTRSEKCDLSAEQAAALENGADITDLRDEIYDGNYIHFGRLNLMYLERDSSEGYRYNEETSAWDPVPNSELLSLRQNVRIARGDSAISTMTTPIRVNKSAAADAS